MASHRLTNDLRNAFVEAVMKDVPQINYSTQLREARSKAREKHIPAKIKALLKDPVLANWINKQSDHLFNWREPDYYYCPRNYEANKEFDAKVAKDPKYTALQEAKKAQEDTRDKLEAQLVGVARSCRTVKQLQNALPEFLKYMPTETEDNVSYPLMVVNVAAEFKKAGWPVKPSNHKE